MMLKQAFPEWKSNGGIFFALEQNPATPWRGAVDALSLDLDYYGNRSGSKIVSSLVKALCEDGALSLDSITALAALLIAKYGLSWSRMWEAVTKEYDPLNNYDMKEVFDEDGTRAGSSTSSDAQNIFGFNSAEASPANSSSMQGSVSETTGTNHTLTRSGNIGVTTSAQMLQGEIDVRMRSFFEIVYTNIDEVLTIPVFGCMDEE